MTDRRVIWMALPLIIGTGLVALGSWSGPPFVDVAWAALPLGFAIMILVGRLGVETETARDGLSMLAAAAFLMAALVGFHALWTFFAYLLGHIRGSGLPPLSPQGLRTVLVVSSNAWEEHWTVLVFWAAVAILPLFAVAALAVPVVLRALAPSREVEGAPWRARWMQPVQLRQLAANRTGLPLGRWRGRLLRYLPSPGWRGGHHFVIAGTRAGKGVSAVLPAILDHDGPIVALDIKGELFATTRRARQEKGQCVVVLNPLDAVEDGSDGFNPLDYVRDDDNLGRDVQVIAEGLVKPEAGSGEHFSDMARRLVAATIEVVVRVGEKRDRNLVEVADMLLGPGLISALEAWRDAPNVVGAAAAQTATAMLAASDRERGAILTTVAKALAWTSSERMRRFLTAPENWSLDNVLDGRTDVFVVVPLDQVEGMAGFMRLVVNLVLGTVARQAGRRLPVRPILLVLDEFVRLGRLAKLLDVATVAAGLGVEALFVAQDRGQIEGTYGREGAATLLGSCATVRVFGLGRTDVDTAKWIVDALGERTVEAHSRQLKGKRQAGGQEQRTALLSVSDLLELPAGELVALFPGRSPARLNRIVSHADPAYRGKLDANPLQRLQ